MSFSAMNLTAQDLIAGLIVLAAALYLARSCRRALVARRSGCGSCGSCPGGAQGKTPATLQLVELQPPRK